MLINLHVKNLALIEETDVDFTDHLNILTGETGAGKSILIGSIQSALGGKIPKEMIRKGADSALIELIFHTTNQEVEKKMEEYDIPFEGGDIIISRRITNHRVINKINDCTVTIAKLKELSPMLLDLSGQHENQLLLDPRNHLKILDNFHKTEIAPVKSHIASLYHEYQKMKSDYDKQNIGEEERLRELEFLKFEINEIEQAHLKKQEDEELEETYQTMAHSKDIISVCSMVHALTSSTSGNAEELIGKSVRDLTGIEGLDPSLGDLNQQLITIDSLLSDFNRELADYIVQMEYDPQTLMEIEGRLDLINHLKSKYGSSIEQVLAYEDNAKNRYEQLDHHQDYLLSLERDMKKLQKSLDEECERLTDLRVEAARPLAHAIQSALLDLNFIEVQFEINFKKTASYSAEGNDSVCFMISTNPGQEIRPLHEIASGGELSRIMLAIKSILADEENIETLIFDEIDTGISGRTAQKVSERLSSIANNRQVIAITHLPQIAAMSNSHYLIKKTSDTRSTISNIFRLSEEESVVELARMLGGAQITPAVLENAKEMKSLAKKVSGTEDN